MKPPEFSRKLILAFFASFLHLFLMGQMQAPSESAFSPEKLEKQIGEATKIRTVDKNPSQAMKILLGLLRDEEHFLSDSLTRFRLYNATSRAFKDLQLEKERGVYLKKALGLNPRGTWADPTTEYYLLSDLAGFFIKENQPDSALTYYQKAKASIFSIEGVKKYSQELSSLNNIGMLYTKMENLDSAQFYYSMALDGYMDSINADTGLWMSINDNLAENNIAKDKLSRAKELYEQNLQLSLAYSNSRPKMGSGRQIKSLLGKVKVLELQGRYREGIAELLILESTLKRSRIPVALIFKKNIHLQFQELYEATGQLKLALMHSEKGNAIREAMIAKSQIDHDEALRTLAEFNLQDLEERLAMEQEENEIKLELSSTRSRIRLLFIVFAALIIIGVLVVIMFRIRRFQAQREERLKMVQALISSELKQKELEREKLELEFQNEQNEKSRIQLELGHKQKDVEALALDINRKKEWAERLLEFTSSLRNMKEVDRLLSLSDLECEIRQQLQTSQRQQKFQEKVDLVNHEFFMILDQRFPSITSTEKELCGFIRMKLTNAEIATNRNISDASVRTARYRLRKKMGLNRDQDLGTFIENLKNNG